MRYVAEVTSIRLPRIHRVFNIPGEGYYLSTGYTVMDYIEGQCLADIWNVLEPERRENVVRQVAEMIRQLQSIHLSTPGPIGGGPCRGMWFTVYGAGPFNHKLAVCKRLKNAKEDTPRFDF
jgi:aminoglycoside phosphotransferase (APT) family kinase protein